MAVSTSRDTILIERRYAAVLDTLSDQSLATLTMAVGEKLRDPLAKVLGLPAGSFDDASTIAGKVRAGLAARKAYLDVGILLAEGATEKAIEMLGDRSDDPSLEDLQMIITPLSEEFTLDAVRLMAVQYSVSLGGFRKLVASDERFAIPTSGAKAAVASAAAAKDEAAQAEKRRLRAERKEKDRQARQTAEAQRRAARGRQ
ncbi:MAG: hypothetical protein ACO321_05480 [Ilumatobacteraceae bacterium]|jgi:hypothetical protein